MKTRAIKLTTLIIGILLISSSCSIQKRRYLKGYYVSWNRNFNVKHQPTKTTQLNVKKDIKKINLTKNPIGIKTHKKVKNQTLNNKKHLNNNYQKTNNVKNKHLKNTSTSHIKNNTNVNNLKINKPYSIDVVTDSTTVNEQQNEHIVPVENKKASNALIVFILSIWLFIFGGFIGIIVSYFIAIKALNQIRDNPKIYKSGEKIKPLAVIILFNIFAFALLAVTSVVMFYDTLIFIFFVAALIYALCAIIGLIILRQKTLERRKKAEIEKHHKGSTPSNQSKPNQKETSKNKDKVKPKKSHKQLVIFLLVSILSFGLYLIIN